MTPGSFDIDTSKKMLGDERIREVEAKARDDADKGNFDPPQLPAQFRTYWVACQLRFEIVVYEHQHIRRLQRIARMKDKPHEN